MKKMKFSYVSYVLNSSDTILFNISKYHLKSVPENQNSYLKKLIENTIRLLEFYDVAYNFQKTSGDFSKIGQGSPRKVGEFYYQKLLATLLIASEQKKINEKYEK